MTVSPLTFVVVHRNDFERAQIKQALEAIPGVRIAGERNDLRAGLALAHQVRPDVLVLEHSAGEDALAAAAQYRLSAPDTGIFLSADSVNPDMLVRAMRAGVQEVLKRPLDRAALADAVERVAQLNQRKLGGGSSKSVVTVFSNKGGVGVTTIAVNLALAIRRLSGREVALADFDYQSGDAMSMLGLTPHHSIGDLLGVDRIDSPAVQAVLARHAGGLMVLPQPDHVDQADALTAHQTGSLLEVLGAMHETVVVDAPHVFNDIALEIFDRSSTILLVVEMSIPSVRAARRSLELFQRLNYLAVPDRVRVLVNRRAEKHAIAPAMVEETLGMPITYVVANDYPTVSESINLGRPLCEQTPASRVGRDLEAVARALLPAEVAAQDAEAAAPRRKLRLFGR